jgi:hypothetical protein
LHLSQIVVIAEPAADGGILGGISKINFLINKGSPSKRTPQDKYERSYCSICVINFSNSSFTLASFFFFSCAAAALSAMLTSPMILYPNASASHSVVLQHDLTDLAPRSYPVGGLPLSGAADLSISQQL